jgi:thiol-disulfide isomerase/thioredoxin
MRNLSRVLIPLLLSVSLAGYGQQKFKINGVVESKNNYEGGNAYLYYFASDTTDGQIHSGGILDSCTIADNKFKFEGLIAQKSMGFFLLAPKGTDFLTVFSASKETPTKVAVYLENGIINVNLHPDNPRFSKTIGTINNNILQESRPIIARHIAKEDSIKSLLATDKGISDDVKLKIGKTLETLTAERTSAIAQIIRKHPNNLASLDLLAAWVNPTINFREAKELYGSLNTGLKKHQNAINYQVFLDMASQLIIGAVAPNFSLNDPMGNSLELAKYRGKYLLVDFWASWCVPCRQDNPNLVKIYNAYKNKNFEILGVSLDGGMADSKNRWIKAIETDKLTWPQVSDLKGWSSPIAVNYLINAIPMNYLLDPEGKIIAKNLRGADLEKELSKITL